MPNSPPAYEGGGVSVYVSVQVNVSEVQVGTYRPCQCRNLHARHVTHTIDWASLQIRYKPTSTGAARERQERRALDVFTVMTREESLDVLLCYGF